MTEVEENKMPWSRFKCQTSSSHNKRNINSINYLAIKTYNAGDINRAYHLRNRCRIKKENVWHVGWERPGSAEHFEDQHTSTLYKVLICPILVPKLCQKSINTPRIIIFDVKKKNKAQGDPPTQTWCH